MTFCQRIRGFLWHEHLQVLAQYLLPKNAKNRFSHVINKKLGRSKTTIFTAVKTLEGHLLQQNALTNESMGYLSNNGKPVGLNLEKFLGCKNSAMREVIKEGQQTGITHLAISYVF